MISVPAVFQRGGENESAKLVPLACKKLAVSTLSFVCELLGYLSRAGRPSASWSYTKRTRKNKSTFSMASSKEDVRNKQIRKQISLRDRVSQRRETHSGVKSSTVHKKEEEFRRRAVIGFEIPVTRARIRNKVGKHRWHRYQQKQHKLAEMSGQTQITSWSTACLKVGERKQLNQPRSWWNRMKHQPCNRTCKTRATSDSSQMFFCRMYKLGVSTQSWLRPLLR